MDENKVSDTDPKQGDSGQPIQAPPPPAPPKPNNPIVLVLQWLTYAFWGWFALAMAWLMAVVIGFYVVGTWSQDWSDVIAYPIASVIVLFLVAATIDFFYTRKEPPRKEGFATAIMVIHVVIYALCGIGSLIVAVFMGIRLLLDGGAGETWTTLIVALLMVAIYALLVVRATMVAKLRKLPMIVTIVFGVVALAGVIAGLAGPFAQSILTKQDRRIEATLPMVKSSIDKYVHDHNALPTTLGELQFNSYDNDAKSVVNDGLITYKANAKPAESTNKDYYTAYDRLGATVSKTYYYQLCVTYKAEKQYYDSARDDEGTAYSTYIDTSTHGKGQVCYDLATN